MSLDYINQEISIIPCKTAFDEKEQVWTGKIPAIRDWSQYCTEVPEIEEVKRWGSIKGVSGIGIVTGEASNICCIDIDTEDPDLIKKLREIIPYTPCVIQGNPKRGGKYLYRLFDSIHEYKPIEPQKQKVKHMGKTVVDILYGNSYLVAPPSLHSKKQDGEAIYYKWEDPNKSLLKVGVHNLPILNDPFIKDKIEMALKGISNAEMEHNLPAGAIDLSGVGVKNIEMDGHRHDDMVSFVAGLIAKKTDPTTAVRELLNRDIARNPSNQYFKDKTKGHKSDSVEINAMKFYMGNLEQKNRNKKKSEQEIPVLAEATVYVPSAEWPELNTGMLTNKLPTFNYGWIPNDDMRKLVQDASMANSIAPQNLFFYMLSGFSAVVGNKVKVQPYRNNTGYVETCNLYVGIVASSGERKSETTSIALKPLKKLNKQVKEDARKDNENKKRISKDIEKLISSKEKKRDAEIEKEGLDSDYAKELLEEIDVLKAKIPKPCNPSLYEQNTTIQKLYEIAEENQEGLFIEFNEFGTKWRDLQAKGNEAEKSFFLDGWDGRRQFMYKTKHHGENSIDELCLSVGFSAQFDIMESVIADLVRNSGMNDGLLQRFLVFCSDVTTKVPTDISFSFPVDIHNIYSNAYYIENAETPVTLDDEAYELWMNFLGENSHKKETEKNPAIVSAISKYTGLILRLCGVLEVIKCNGNRPTFVSASTFKTAWQMIDYAELHLRHIFSLDEKRKVDNIISAFKTGSIEDETTVRDLYRFHQKLFGKDANEVMKVLERLAMRGIIKVIKDGRTNKIKINPAIYRV